ncbi:MAG: M20/M25/M40 family metallo-hydrolase [Ruminococcus sp.]
MLPEAVCNRIHANQADAVKPCPAHRIPQRRRTPAPGWLSLRQAAADALDFMLHQLRTGLTCTNYEYHMGAADWDASLPQHLGILCHLDVVPAVPSNWKSDPFTAEIRDGRIYGRGAIDDKGPAVAVLYALRAIRESGIPLRKNVRFLLGCNEENGSTDLEYYMARHAMPPQVFTPDGSYPIIHLEKGMLRLQFTKATADPIARFSAGTAPNAVPADAAVSLSAAFCGTAEQGSQITRQNELAYKGIAAHASTPESATTPSPDC